MARIRVYIQPFNDTKTYSGTWVEVTRDVKWSGIGTISYKLDNSDYDVGIFTNASLSLTLINNSGKYSDVGSIENPIFKYKRADSLVKITYDEANYDFYAGVTDYGIMSTGEMCGSETTIFTGLLNDDSTTMQLQNYNITFNVLGYESILDRAITPDWVSSPPADNKCSTLIKAILNAANAAMTQSVLTIDNTKINPGNDVSFDDLSKFAQKTCKSSLRDILLAANSVMYLSGSTPIVSARTESTALKYNFYGPGSTSGPENILNIRDIRNGLNRTFNYVTWGAGASGALSSQDASSITAYGARSKDINISGITNGTTKQSVIDNIKNEFKNPKQEFILDTPLKTDRFALSLLDKCSIDYPLVPISTETLALYDVAVYGVDQYPIVVSQFQIYPTDYYKILSFDINLISNMMSLTMRKI